jgi:hypothetical protein
MEYEHIDTVVKEIEEIMSPIKDLLRSTADGIKQATIENLGTKKLSQIEKFSKELIDTAAKIPEDKKAQFLNDGVVKMHDFVKAEQKNASDNLIKLNEKQNTLLIVIEHFEKQIASMKSRKQAIERVASGDVDEKHPERIGVVREAEKLKRKKE